MNVQPPDGPGHGSQPPAGIDAVISRMREVQAAMPAADGRRHFHAVYTRTTEAVAHEIRTAALGGFLDPDWVERWMSRSLISI